MLSGGREECARLTLGGPGQTTVTRARTCSLTDEPVGLSRTRAASARLAISCWWVGRWAHQVARTKLVPLAPALKPVPSWRANRPRSQPAAPTGGNRMTGCKTCSYYLLLASRAGPGRTTVAPALRQPSDGCMEGTERMTCSWEAVRASQLAGQTAFSSHQTVGWRSARIAPARTSQPAPLAEFTSWPTTSYRAPNLLSDACHPLPEFVLPGEHNSRAAQPTLAAAATATAAPAS